MRSSNSSLELIARTLRSNTEHYVHLVCQSLGRLNRCNVRIDQHRLDVLLLVRFDSLTSGVIELTSLSDTQSTTSKHNDFLHRTNTRVLKRVRGLSVVTNLSCEVQELVEQEGRVVRSTSSLRMELHGEERFGAVNHTLVRTVVRVDEVPVV